MKQRDSIHSVIVSYNRLELTKQAISSYLETVSLPFTLWVVDNGSEPDVEAELILYDGDYGVMLLGENRYPGYATNLGWTNMPPGTTILHRADNDFAFLPGWCDHVLAALENQEVGQVGLRTDAEELWNTHNVGGNCVIRRQLWDQGLRYDERPWGEISKKVPGYTEDSFMSPRVRKMGWEWARVKEPCIVSLSREDVNDPYYRETWRVRGIKPPGSMA
jgi:glycosyltransferase involved in cell wall biosynthesis